MLLLSLLDIPPCYRSLTRDYKHLKMAPPKYGDLGKQANDVFSKGYNFGLIKLEVKTKTSTGVEFTTGGNSNMETGKVAGNLETKYQVKDLGMTLTEKWTTDNSLNTTVDVVDKVNTNKLLAEKENNLAFSSWCPA